MAFGPRMPAYPLKELLQEVEIIFAVGPHRDPVETPAGYVESPVNCTCFLSHCPIWLDHPF